VATWDADAEVDHPLDFRLVHNSFVTMFWRLSLLEETVEWLRSHSYEIADFDASSWARDADMYAALAVRLNFPEYFGGNLDALDDCMRDVASGDYGWSPDATGLVIVLRGFDAFTEVHGTTAQSIIATTARSAILIGHRIICLVQSNNPGLTFERVGATPVMWNDTESLDSTRGL